MLLSMVMLVMVIVKIKDNCCNWDHKYGDDYIHLTSAIQQ